MEITRSTVVAFSWGPARTEAHNVTNAAPTILFSLIAFSCERRNTARLRFPEPPCPGVSTPGPVIVPRPLATSTPSRFPWQGNRMWARAHLWHRHPADDSWAGRGPQRGILRWGPHAHATSVQCPHAIVLASVGWAVPTNLQGIGRMKNGGHSPPYATALCEASPRIRHAERSEASGRQMEPTPVPVFGPDPSLTLRMTERGSAATRVHRTPPRHGRRRGGT